MVPICENNKSLDSSPKTTNLWIRRFKTTNLWIRHLDSSFLAMNLKIRRFHKLGATYICCSPQEIAVLKRWTLLGNTSENGAHFLTVPIQL